jgi:2-polyprenyl-3-methyl-5-hydroxy-6-metoxy-1,4-benzoquinol methylase
VWPEIVCPADGQALETRREVLCCRAGHRWRVTATIPRMVDDARSYADAFGLQWRVYRKTQLDSFTGYPISRDRVQRCIGSDGWRLLSRRERTDVLEVGCGAGRFTEVLLEAGASVTSVDLSDAVDANQENFPQSSRHRILQADALRLPFREQSFDLVLCLGVVQHTPDPEETIRKLFAQVRPGGWLVLDHYTHSLSHFTKTAPLFRFVLRRMEPRRGLQWSERLVNLFFPLHRAARSSRLAQALVSRFSPVLTYFHSLPLNDDLQRQWALLDTHDSLTDWYNHFRTKSQIRRSLDSLGADQIWCEYGGNGVEARCRRAS